MPWVIGDEIRDPTANQVLVDTGALPGGQVRLELVAYADMGMDLLLERRNGDDSARQGNAMVIALRDARTVIPFAASFPSQPGERYRVLARSAATGTAQVSLSWEQ